MLLLCCWCHHDAHYRCCSCLSSAINARELALNKKLAGNQCALSLVRQLYHMGAIDSSKAPVKKLCDQVITVCKVYTCVYVRVCVCTASVLFLILSSFQTGSL